MSSPGRSSGIVRFGVFEVDLRAGELYRAGHKIKLQIQPFHALALLLERPGEVVHTRGVREEALARRTHCVDFDHSLNTAIKKVAPSFGRTTKRSRVFVETLPSAATGSSASRSTQRRRRPRSLRRHLPG